MKDERIQTTVNRYAAIGFFIWYVLMMITLDYRLLILKQHPREIWDIFAIFCLGTFFVFLAYAHKGILDHGFKWTWSIIGISAAIGILLVQVVMGQIQSFVDVGSFLIGFLPGIGLVIGIAYFLNLRWQRREGLDDEQ